MIHCFSALSSLQVTDFSSWGRFEVQSIYCVRLLNPLSSHSGILLLKSDTGGLGDKLLTETRDAEKFSLSNVVCCKKEYPITKNLLHTATIIETASCKTICCSSKKDKSGRL